MRTNAQTRLPIQTTTNRAGGRPSVLAPPPQIVTPQPGQARPSCPGCARGVFVINGAPRKSDGGRPVRCSHCGATATLLPDGSLSVRS